MIPEPLPPLLRGLGTLLILLTSALVVTVERRDNAERAEQAHLARIALKAISSLRVPMQVRASRFMVANSVSSTMTW